MWLVSFAISLALKCHIVLRWLGELLMFTIYLL